VDDDPQDAGLRLTHFSWGRRTVVELDTATQCGECPVGYAALRRTDVGEVLLVDTETRMREAVRQLSVVREDEEALGVEVESTDGKHARLVGHKVDDGNAVVLVAGGRHDAGGFVQQIVDEIGSHADRRTVDLDEIVLDVDAPTEHGDFAVHPHPTLFDELLTCTARSDAPLRENLL
jgi:hypothetical protein